MDNKEWEKLLRHMKIIKDNLYTLNNPEVPQKTKDHIIHLIHQREIDRSRLLEKS